MTIENFDVVFYTCIFLLPGFIVKSIIDTLSPPTKYNESKYFFVCLLYSIINCAAWSWGYILLSKLIANHIILYWILMLILTILGAIIIAIIIGYIKQKEITERLFRKLGIKKIHPIPTAWDYYFSKQDSAWIIVTLKNGKTIYGQYSNKSFSSSDADERDLYIEKVYSFKEGEAWEEVERNKGILITKDEIETIEFFS